MNDIVYVGKHSVTYSVGRHAHTMWELIYCTSGQGLLQFEGVSIPYQTGDIIVIPPNSPHSNTSEKGFTNIHINMENATLPFKEPRLVSDDANHFILDAFYAAFFHYSGDREQRRALLSAYGALIACYMVSCQNAPGHSEIVENIEADIIHHYPDCDYDLEGYLRSFPFNYDYLRKLFKKEMGITPHQYLNNKRLQSAAEWLTIPEHNNNVTEASHLSGFREPLYFSRMFKKKYGVSPSFYQEYMQKQLEKERPTGESMRIEMET